MADQDRISQCKATTGRDSGAAAPLSSAVMCAGNQGWVAPQVKAAAASPPQDRPPGSTLPAR
jgi:hypothetical protein